FRWIAADGSEVQVHHLPAAGYEIGSSLPADPKALKARWKEIEELLAPRATADAMLLPAGADHHAPDAELPERIHQLNRIRKGLEFRIGSPMEYFATIPRSLRAPRVAGELRFSYRYTLTLQGAHATRASLKRAVREGDALLTRWAEPQIALTGATGSGGDGQGLLNAAWREHLLNHFH